MHRDTNPRIVELKAAKLKHANDVDIIMNIFGWSSFELARSDKYLTKSLKHWVKQPQRLCITKRGRPTLPSSTRLARPPARPHHPCNPWICNWRDAAADVRVNFKVVGVDFEVFYRDQSSYPKLSRSCAGHLRTVPNGSEAPPNGSEQFRGPLCRFTSGFYEWFACRFRSARSLGSFL